MLHIQTLRPPLLLYISLMTPIHQRSSFSCSTLMSNMEFHIQALDVDGRALIYATGPLVGLSRTTGASVCKSKHWGCEKTDGV